MGGARTYGGHPVTGPILKDIIIIIILENVMLSLLSLIFTENGEVDIIFMRLKNDQLYFALQDQKKSEKNLEGQNHG